jgi:hypothetical protein
LGHLAGKAALEVTNFTMMRVKIAAMFGRLERKFVGEVNVCGWGVKDRHSALKGRDSAKKKRKIL